MGLIQFPAPFIFIDMKIIITESQYLNLRIKRRYYELKKFLDEILAKNYPYTVDEYGSYLGRIFIDFFLSARFKEILKYDDDEIKEIAPLIIDIFGDDIKKDFERKRRPLN